MSSEPALPEQPLFSKDDITVIFVLGGPGVGKGTQCAKLTEKFDFVHLSAGDLLREEQSRTGSVYCDLIQECLREGRIVPMHITIALLAQAMQASSKRHFLVDGFPRNVPQGVDFEARVCECTMLLFLDCTEETMLARLSGRSLLSGRVDDNIDSIKKRLVTYREATLPVIDHYEAQGKVQRIDCNGSVDEVYAQVCSKLGSIMPSLASSQ